MFRWSFVRLFDPRGRICRAEMLMLACALLGLEIMAMVVSHYAAEAGATLVFALKSLMILIGLSATIKRLHDIGISGWWVLGAAALLCMWTAIIAVGGLFVVGKEVLSPGSAGHLAILGLVMLPPVAMTLWLHLAEGEKHKNVYGAPINSRLSDTFVVLKPKALENSVEQNRHQNHHRSEIAA